jgi:membrane protease YdiL (CAAX protease family)
VISALAFSFDPFMVGTFRHLHWIAVWDGIVWGMMWVRRRNLYATIAAHAVEVMVMYSSLKLVLAS